MKIFKLNFAGKLSASLLMVLLLFGFNLKSETLKNGYYIKVHSDSVAKDIYQKMSVTLNENCWMSKDNLLESYIYLPSGANGFSLVMISGGTETTFSPLENVHPVDKWLYYEPQPQSNFLRGQFGLGTKKFTVTESGLYYIAADVATNWVICLPIKKWNLLGTALLGGWEPAKLNELIPVFSADKKSAVFTIDSLEVKPGFLKFRFANGWKITVDSVSDNECWNKGSKVNTNFGGSIDSLILGGGNILSHYRGIYTVKLFWDFGKPLRASFDKIKDIPMVDYSDCKMGLLGDAYSYSDGKRSNWENNWGEGKGTNAPVKEGNLYTWSFENVTLFNGGEFKFRQGYDWMGLAIDFQDIKSWSGDAKDDFKNMDSKFHVVNAGQAFYNITLSIDATTEIVSCKVDRRK